MLDFGSLPPEINSARMYAGPGSAPMVAAASAWNWLSAELDSAATGYGAIVTQLTGDEWRGPAAVQMATAATPYIAWLRATALQAEQAATQARAAANAYEIAFAATVPPPLIEANRVQLIQAVATNTLGQNTPLITQLEAEYAEMWACDAAAMYGYAGQTVPTARVAPFTEPTRTTNLAGQLMQAAAVSRAAETSAGAGAHSAAAESLLSAPRALTALSSPAAGTDTVPASLSELLKMNPAVDAWATFAGPVQNSLAMMYRTTGMATHFQKLFPIAAAAKAAGDGAKAAAAAPGLEAVLGGLSGGGSPVSAGLGSAVPAGGLSVPPAWSGATSPSLPASASPLPMTRISATPEPVGAGNLLGGMPLAGAGAGGTGVNTPRYGFRPTVMMRPAFAG